MSMSDLPPFLRARPSLGAPPPPAVAAAAGPPGAMPAMIGLRHFAACDFADITYISGICRRRLPPGSAEPIYGHMRRGSPTIGVVAVLEGRVIGYMLYVARAGEVELVDLGVEPYYRRRTAGTRLVKWLRGRLGPVACGPPRTRIEMAVSEASLDLLLFLQVQGFAAMPDARGKFTNASGTICMRFEPAWAAGGGLDTGCGPGGAGGLP